MIAGGPETSTGEWNASPCRGQLDADAGRVMVCGHTHPAGLKAIRNATGYVPEEPPLQPGKEVEDIARIAATYFAVWDAGVLADLLDCFQIGVGRKVQELGRGRKMLLTLARGVGALTLVFFIAVADSGGDHVGGFPLIPWLGSLPTAGLLVVAGLGLARLGLAGLGLTGYFLMLQRGPWRSRAVPE